MITSRSRTATSTWVTTVGFIESNICCWNAAAIAYSFTALSNAARLSASRPFGYCCCAALRNCCRRKSFANATGQVPAVWAANLSAANCSGVARGLSAVIEASSTEASSVVSRAATGAPD